jgi:pimeloyl-ACP methyl ester carboxylesterase
MSTYTFAGRDGAVLACRETGSGRPLILLHGFTGSGSHMLGHGLAPALAQQGWSRDRAWVA